MIRPPETAAVMPGAKAVSLVTVVGSCGNDASAFCVSSVETGAMTDAFAGTLLDEGAESGVVSAARPKGTSGTALSPWFRLLFDLLLPADGSAD